MKQVVDNAEQFPGRGGPGPYTETISHFVERKLHDGDNDFYTPKRGIEDRIARVEAFCGQLAEALVAKDLMTAERVVELICGWHGRDITVVDVPDETR